MLITTQNQHWPSSLALDVPVLDVEAAAGFPGNRTGDQDREAARELAGALGGLPLALEQPAAYIQAATTVTMAGYLLLFRGRQPDLLARGEVAEHTADHRPIGHATGTQPGPTHGGFQDRICLSPTWAPDLGGCGLHRPSGWRSSRTYPVRLDTAA